MTNSEEFIAELKRQLEENTQKDFIDELANLLYNNQPKIDCTDPFSIANFLYDNGYRKVKKTATELAREAETETLRNKTFQEMENKIYRLEKLLDDKCDRCIAKDRKEAAKEFADKMQGVLKFYENHSAVIMGQPNVWKGTIYYAMQQKINEIEKEFEDEEKKQ